jgi:hypothetical protein
MLWVLLGIIVVLFMYLHCPREGFSLLGREIVNISPFFGENTCKPDEELSLGLCYPKCKSAYHGTMTICTADSRSIGVGVPVLLEPCDKPGRKAHNLPDLPFPDHGDYNNDGLTCRQPLSGGECNTHCDGNWSWSDGGFCHTHCNPIRGGNVVGRLNSGGICPDDHPEKIDGLCYKKCPPPEDPNLKNHMPGMPYLCYGGGPITYDRGPGKIPSLARIGGKYPIF